MTATRRRGHRVRRTVRRDDADGSRLHLQHGPIDLIVEAFGAREQVADAYRLAWERFRFVLDELVEELPALRRPLGVRVLAVRVARRMAAAVRPFDDRFITPMAAVAGAVADEILLRDDGPCDLAPRLRERRR